MANTMYPPTHPLSQQGSNATPIREQAGGVVTPIVEGPISSQPLKEHAGGELPPEKQKELMEGGLVGDLNKFVDWIGSMIEDMGGDPENPKDIADFMANPNPHQMGGFGIGEEGGRVKLPSNIPSIANPDAKFFGTGGSEAPEGGATTQAAPENPNPFTRAGTNIGPPMHEATGNYTRGGEFRFSPSPNEAFGGGGTTSAQAAPERNVNPGSGEKKDEGKEKVVAPTGTQPTPEKKEEKKKETGGTESKGGDTSTGGSEEQEVEALRGLANLVLGGGGPPQPGLPSGGLGGGSKTGAPIGGVATPQQSLNPFGTMRKF